MKMFVVRGRHPRLQPEEFEICDSMDGAMREAAKLLAIIHDDWLRERREEYGYRGKELPEIASPSPQNWQEVLEEMLRWDVSHDMLNRDNDYIVAIEEKIVKSDRQ